MIFKPLTKTTYRSDEGYTVSLNFGFGIVEARCGMRRVYLSSGEIEEDVIAKAMQACRDDLAQARAA